MATSDSRFFCAEETNIAVLTAAGNLDPECFSNCPIGLSRTTSGVQCEPTERLDYVVSPLRRQKWDPPVTPKSKLDEPLVESETKRLRLTRRLDPQPKWAPISCSARHCDVCESLSGCAFSFVRPGCSSSLTHGFDDRAVIPS